MTLQQIKYLETIAKLGSVSKAANELFMAQSSLSAAVKEVEKEYNIVIFERSSKGVMLTHQGKEFMTDLRYITNYYEYIDEKYRHVVRDNKRMCVSSHHHICGESAFLTLIQSMSYQRYHFGYLEGSTTFVLDNVANNTSDIGLIFYTVSTKSILFQELKKRELNFNHIAYGKLYIYVCDTHPLACRTEVTSAEIIDYPFIAYDSLDPNSGMFTVSSQQRHKNMQNFYVTDRATAYSILRMRNAYATGTGHLSPDSRNNDIVSIPISDMENIEIGWLVKDNYALSEITMAYISLIKKQYM